ncbi:hypothetical protein AMS68_001461 [Peltaster fructicola]|uniref:Acyl-coenzyme A diphosphatase SCS3 n=1 Tax=Peltaster fructicola TaxID=286661 RepID=A0A6H0XMJ4_9PEZI|nr:hypothetical protein AMS68_001461 [Peltaster fructicola]
MATRRKNVRVDVPLPTNSDDKASAILNDSSTMAQLDAPPPFESPFLPTLLEALLLSVYPATLIIGSVFSTLTVNHANTPYIAHMQSYDPKNAPSYFAKKSNIFNVYFVKVGWAWVTAAFALFVMGNRALGPVDWLAAPQKAFTKKRIQAITRYAFLTVIWYIFTQGFFGASLIDRGYRITGGKCEVVLSDAPLAQLEKAQMSDAEEALTHAACKLIGGQWKGGHDISGHVFLLVMGSAMLGFEVLPVLLKYAGLTRARRVVGTDGAVKSAETEEKAGEHLGRHSVFANLALGVAAVSLWMLLMTAAYFHTWFEKFTGLLVALIAIYITYFLPRAIPALRSVLGMPGV